jgi:hypothetical protein
MPRKRDGPAPQRTTPGPGVDERAQSLPPPKILRKSARTTPLSQQHHRSRRRQDRSWRGFSVRLYAPPGSDGAHALYTPLKLAAQRYGLEVASVDEIPTN